MATYRRRHLLPEVVDALLDQDALTELIVVVDGDRDGSYEYLVRRRERDERLVPVWTENRGASAAQQLGLGLARGEVVLMFDDDQIARPGLVAGHAAHHLRHDDRVVVGYVRLEIPEDRAPGDFILRDYALNYEDDLDSYEREPDLILRALWGGNVSLRREHALSLGWHNPRFVHRFHYDQEFGLRCHAAGLTGVVDRLLIADHRYVKTLDGYLREAREQGRAQQLLRTMYPASLPGGWQPVAGGRGSQTLQRFARRRRGHGPTLGLLKLACRAAARLNAHGWERKFGGVAWYIEFQRGIADENRRIEVDPA